MCEKRWLRYKKSDLDTKLHIMWLRYEKYNQDTKKCVLSTL